MSENKKAKMIVNKKDQNNRVKEGKKVWSQSYRKNDEQ